jgi:hypothetical protein
MLPNHDGLARRGTSTSNPSDRTNDAVSSPIDDSPCSGSTRGRSRRLEVLVLVCRRTTGTGAAERGHPPGRTGPSTRRVWQHIAELRMSPRFPIVGDAGRPLGWMAPDGGPWGGWPWMVLGWMVPDAPSAEARVTVGSCGVWIGDWSSAEARVTVQRGSLGRREPRVVSGGIGQPVGPAYWIGAQGASLVADVVCAVGIKRFRNAPPQRQPGEGGLRLTSQCPRACFSRLCRSEVFSAVRSALGRAGGLGIGAPTPEARRP